MFEWLFGKKEPEEETEQIEESGEHQHDFVKMHNGNKCQGCGLLVTKERQKKEGG